jgi:hypothetical protein
MCMVAPAEAAGGQLLRGGRGGSGRARLAALAAAVRSLVRGGTLLFVERPGTPLRILCIVAFDTVHRLRTGKRLTAAKVKLLAALLDFGASANAVLDGKRRQECRPTLQLVRRAGSSFHEYVPRLEALERLRPVSGGDDTRFHEVSAYREAVVRLSLGMLAATADVCAGLDEGIAQTHADGDLNLLFRIVMQCQILDDAIDVRADQKAGLPGFLTASGSPGQAVEETRGSVRSYAEGGGRGAELWPLRLGLRVVTLCARVVLRVRLWQASSVQLSLRECLEVRE